MSISFALMLVVSVVMAAPIILDPSRFMEYPVLIGLLMLSWFLPQAWGIERAGPPWVNEPGATWTYVAASLACMAGGFSLGKRVRAGERPTRSANSDGGRSVLLTVLAACFVVFGSLSYFLMIRESVSFAPGERWTGVITAYAFGANFLPIGSALAFLLALRSKSRSAFIVFVVGLFVYLPVIIVSVKRAPSFEIVAVLAGGLFFVKRFVPPRLLIIVAAGVGTVLIHQAGDLRSYTRTNNATVVDGFTSGTATRGFSVMNLEGGKIDEVRNAVTDIALVNQGASIRPFASIWNQLVSQYYPAFLFGREAKNALLATTFENSLGEQSRYEGYAGSTRTGFADSYTAFAFAGVLPLGITAAFFGWIYGGAVAGRLRDQFLYIILLSDGLLVITHSMATFISQLPLNFLVVWLVVRLSRQSYRARARPPSASSALSAASSALR